MEDDFGGGGEIWDGCRERDRDKLQLAYLRSESSSSNNQKRKVYNKSVCTRGHTQKSKRLLYSRTSQNKQGDVTQLH